MVKKYNEPNLMEKGLSQKYIKIIFSYIIFMIMTTNLAKWFKWFCIYRTAKCIRGMILVELIWMQAYLSNTL